MQQKNICSFLSILCFLSFAMADIKIETFVQPMYSFRENGSWNIYGESGFSLHRAKLSLQFTKRYNTIKILSKLEVDFTEADIENVLENAYINVKFLSPLNIKVGRFKIPFGANSLTSSFDLWTIYRSYTTKHIRDELKVGGYQNGGILYGSFFKYFYYSVGVFNYDENHIEGTHIKDILDFPVVKLSYIPTGNISISYMFTVPQAGVSMGNGDIDAMRLFLHDFSVEFSLKEWYECFTEIFIGIDTSDVKKAQLFLQDYKENVAYSIYTLHSFIISLSKKIDLRLTNGFEYLNGLNYEAGKRVNRSFYFSLIQAVGVSFGKKLSLEISYDNKYNEVFKSVDYRRIAGQIGFKNSMKINKGKKKKGKKK